MDLNSMVASRIKELRIRKNITAEAMAKDLCISKAAYSQLENGKIQITLNRLEALAKIWSMSVSFIINEPKETIQMINYESGLSEIKLGEALKILNNMLASIKR